MKKKLTITVDAALIPRAKSYARSRRVSLSSIIEQSLRDLAGGEHPPSPRAGAGGFQAANRGDQRYDRLARKYL